MKWRELRQAVEERERAQYTEIIRRFSWPVAAIRTASPVGGIHLEDGRLIKAAEAVHLDQGIAVTSHASQGKSVDQVIVSVPVSAFSQTNQAQFYVSMSRARAAMYLFTDSKVALREAVCRPSERLSPWELLDGNRRERALVKQAQQPQKRPPIPA